MSWFSDGLVLSEDFTVAQFTDILIEIVNKTIPKSHISIPPPPRYPGLTTFVNKLLKNVKKHNEKLSYNSTAENVLAFKQLKASARHTIYNQKTSWKNVCTSLNSTPKRKTVWKANRKIKGKSQLPL